VEETFSKRLEDAKAFSDDDDDDDDNVDAEMVNNNNNNNSNQRNKKKQRLPPHFAETLPCGLVLAGGVNADDHEETFQALAKFLAKADFHCALLQSKDVRRKSRGGVGGVGGSFASSAASRGILGECVSIVARQLASRNSQVGGVALDDFLNLNQSSSINNGNGANNNINSNGGVNTVRHIASWYESTLVGSSEYDNENAQHHHNHHQQQQQQQQQEQQNKNALAYSLRRERIEMLPQILGRPRPVVVLVSDVEGFQGSPALSDLLSSFASFHRDVPFILLLGIATNTSALQRSIPSETASKLRPKVFKLFAPGDASREIREKVFLDPTLFPALGFDALTYLHTRFMEHDFSLTTMRKSVKVLYLNHFATERLSYVCRILSEKETKPRENAIITTGENANGLGTNVINNNSETTKRELQNLLKGNEKYSSAHEAMKWYLDRFCGTILTRNDEKSIEMLEEHFFPSSLLSKKKDEDDDDGLEKDDEKDDERMNDDIFNKFTENMLSVRDYRKKFAVSLEILATISAKVGFSRWSRTADVLLDCAHPNFFFSSSPPPMMSVAAAELATTTTTTTTTTTNNASAAAQTTTLLAVAEGEKFLRILSSRIERAMANAAANNNKELLKDLCVEVVKVCEQHEEIRANEGARFLQLFNENNNNDVVVVGEVEEEKNKQNLKIFEEIIRDVVKNYASKPPESFAGKKIFCVTSADAARETFSAAPRMAIETALSNPSEALECLCCPKSGEVSATLPDPCLCYNLLENFGGESANAFELFREFIMQHRDTTDEELGLLQNEFLSDVASTKKGKRTTKDDNTTQKRENDKSKSKRQKKHTFGVDKQKIWALQARFTRACAELEFLGVASARRFKKADFLVRTAFPLDFASK